MKTIRSFISLSAGILIASVNIGNLVAQAPQKISYQAVVRNNDVILVSNQGVGMKISILKESETGIVVYQEIYNPNPVTNQNGLVGVEIGGGIPVQGTFGLINWADGPHFVKVEVDPTGATNYTISGTSQILSVPYSLLSKKAETIDYTNITNPPDLSVYATSTSLDGKVDKIPGKGLSANDYTDAEKTKLAALEKADGSETIITVSENMAIEGAGTIGSPYQISANSGNSFVRYGSDSAPAGTTLLYSGYLYGSYYSFSRTDPVVIKSGDPGFNITATEALLYPIATWGTAVSGITNGVHISAAVCFSEFPTTLVWGTHTVPAGWKLLYQGYAYGSYYNHNGPITGPICIDSDNFKVNQPISMTNPIYPVKIASAAPGDQVNSCLKCMVIYKEY